MIYVQMKFKRGDFHAFAKEIDVDSREHLPNLFDRDARSGGVEHSTRVEQQ